MANRLGRKILTGKYIYSMWENSSEKMLPKKIKFRSIIDKCQTRADKSDKIEASKTRRKRR